MIISFKQVVYESIDWWVGPSVVVASMALLDEAPSKMVVKAILHAIGGIGHAAWPHVSDTLQTWLMHKDSDVVGWVKAQHIPFAHVPF